MVSPVPQPVVPKAGLYTEPSNTFTDMTGAFQFFQPKLFKMSKNSPPLLNIDVIEGEMVIDKTALRIYTCLNGALRYVQLT